MASSELNTGPCRHEVWEGCNGMYQNWSNRERKEYEEKEDKEQIIRYLIGKEDKCALGEY